MGQTLGIFVILFFVLLGFIMFNFLLTYLKSHRLRVRDTTNNSSYINDYWIIEKKNKDDGSMWWHSVWFQDKLKLPKPPSKCIDVGKKGRKYAEVYRLSEDEYVYAKDEGVKANVELVEGGIKNLLKPFSVVQRQTIIHQFTKAEADNPNKFRDFLLNTVPVLALVGVIIFGMIFFADIAKGVGDIMDKESAIADKFIKMESICSGNQLPETPPIQNSNLITQQGETPPKQNG